MFIFGARSHEVAELRQQRVGYPVDPRFTAALDMIRNGYFGWAEFFAPIVKGVDGLSPGSDFYLLGPDFAGYIEAQEMVDQTYQDKKKWTKMSILSTAGSGKFSSDRTIQEYANEIWKVKPCKVPDE